MQGLVEALTSDYTGDGYRAELDRVLAEAIEPFEDDADEAMDRLALLIYGATIVAAMGTTLSAEAMNKSPVEIRALLGQIANEWLDNPFAGAG